MWAGLKLEKDAMRPTVPQLAMLVFHVEPHLTSDFTSSHPSFKISTTCNPTPRPVQWCFYALPWTCKASTIWQSIMGVSSTSNEPLPSPQDSLPSPDSSLQTLYYELFSATSVLIAIFSTFLIHNYNSSTARKLQVSPLPFPCIFPILNH